MVRSGYDYRHYMSLDADDFRKGFTTQETQELNKSNNSDDVPDESPAFIVDAQQGDIVLNTKW